MSIRASHNGALGNRLLDAMPELARERLRPALEFVALDSNQTIHEPGETAEHVFFPLQGLISMVAMMEDGTSVEIGMIGKEGMFPVSAILGDDRPSQRAMVQLPGNGLRMPSRLLQQEALTDAALQLLLLRYVQLTLSTAAQTAACNRLHVLEERCARWLLSAHDRAESNIFPMTHDFLSMMLGVRRPGVTIAVQSFRDSGMISYNHGTMSILDRNGLEAASCECYRIIQDESKRLVGSPLAMVAAL